MKIRFTVLVFSALMVLASLQSTSALSGASGQVLYSINMPGNPFQQPDFQMMIKKDNENQLVNFNGSTTPGMTTTGNVFDSQVQTIVTSFDGNYCNSSTFINTDYAAFYFDYADGYFYCTNAFYGISPYTTRGYTEGAAETLYMQRPAQITLPFLPIFKGNGSPAPIPIVATLPDYQDIFLVYSRSNLCASVTQDITGAPSLAFCSKTALSSNVQQPCWHTYIPQIGVSGIGWYNGIVFISYTQLSGLIAGLPESMQVWKISSPGTILGAFANEGFFTESNFVYNYYAGATYYGWFNSYQPLNVCASFIGYNTVAYNSNGASHPETGEILGYPYSVSNPRILSFAPVISPGYNGKMSSYNQQSGIIETVLAGGDLGGNFAGYLDTVNPQGSTTTYDGLGVESMNLFQVFAQNMGCFFKNTTNYLSLNNGTDSVNPILIFSPGQGVFSDAMQLAALQADFVPNSGSSSNSSGSSDLFYGSYGNGNNLSELSVLLGSGVSYNNGLEPTTTPLIAQQPMLSKITTTNFTAAPYMTYAPTDYTTTDLAPQAAITNYYNGINTAEQNNDVYLPLYFADPDFADPGTPLQEIGWNYCDAGMIDDGGLMVYKNPQYYSKAQATMTDFTGNLTGTRAANQPVN